MRFTIRDLLWLTVVVGLAAGWYLDSRSKQATMREQTERLAVLTAHLRSTNNLAARLEELLAMERQKQPAN
jgi:hypothetical protein